MKRNEVAGTVVSVTDKNIVLLCSDGSFKNVPRKGITVFPIIGEIFTSQEISRTRHWLKYSSIASILFLIFIFSLLFVLDEEPTFVVAIDINPSIELYTDKDLNVVKIKAINSDAETLLLGLKNDLIKQPIDMAIEKVVRASIAAGYLDSNESYVVTSIVSLDEKYVQVADTIEANVSSVLATIDHEYAIKTIEKSLYEEANLNQLSVNHMLQAKKLEETGIELNIEEVRGKTIAELRRMERRSIIEDQERKQENQPSRRTHPEDKLNHEQNEDRIQQRNNNDNGENRPTKIENGRKNSAVENRPEQSKEDRSPQPNNEKAKLKDSRNNNKARNNSNSGLEQKNQEKGRQNQNGNNSKKSRP
ncbi:MAG: hypothetical protein LRY71_02430 [Bacillaceae bacterium]|nr:hypothetical protein [Bacillaceae bacterium]